MTRKLSQETKTKNASRLKQWRKSNPDTVIIHRKTARERHKAALQNLKEELAKLQASLDKTLND